jgi:hypothetical protein
MDEVKDVSTLATDISEAWKSLVLAQVNGQNVRLRVMQDRTAEWHVHADSDEALCCRPLSSSTPTRARCASMPASSASSAPVCVIADASRVERR